MEKFDSDVETLLPDRDNSTGRRREAMRRPKNLYVISLSLSLVTIIIFQVVILYASFRNTSFASPAGNGLYKVWKGCGTNASEARSLGCVFDVMMNAWTREECYNKGLSEEYLAEWNFQFFYDVEGTREIPLSVMREGEHTYMYSTEYQHRGHCIYTWKMQALALEAQGRGEVKQCDDETFSYHHTIHCADILANSPREPPYAMGYGDVKFLSCGPYLE
ncbi:hypothetical protein BGW36DRAFT_463353 [Talaromyces proteolyticus]|uniref:Uncharacterized protein n=1 Tax=Talaromyces proteolyticus TaxID=1131652 RepID=A0AAD4KKN5_9EURO|nr:uncharacterized protein BGW36DRAFT_463353 [Talaromyces proteolyticus]KAH8693688.1 hypothetical protein BGW36DRAFT_463353 [Talaromyces proteolyticus]